MSATFIALLAICIAAVAIIFFSKIGRCKRWDRRIPRTFDYTDLT